MIQEDKAIDWTDLGGGIRRKVMAYTDDLMLVKVAFEAGAIGELHHHPHTQVSYVASGTFEITILSETKIVSTGDVFLIPPNEVHGAKCIESGELIDVFNPLRNDFIR